MKIETQPLEDHQVKITVEVEPESLDAAKKRAARLVAKRTKIPGFRPGKAPYEVVLRHVGEPAIIEEALELLVKDVYPQAVEEADIEPYGPGQLENVPSMDPPVLEFVVPLEAEVDLGDYRSLEKPYELPGITDKDVEDVIRDLQERQAVEEPVERPAQEGDVVYVRLSAERKEGEEGESSTLFPERSVPILVKVEDEPDQDEGEEDEEWPFSGFSRLLVGASPNDESSTTYTFPEDSQFEALQGVEAEFHWVVEEVKARVLPEVDDEFATSLGDFSGIEELRSEVRSQLEERARSSYNESYEEEVLSEAIDQATIKYPPQMLEQEVHNVIHNLEHRLENQNLDLDLYLKSREMSMDDLREEARPTAESRLKRSLYLYELARKENIEVSPDALQMETSRAIEDLRRSLPEKEARRLNDRAVVSNIITNIMTDMLIRESINRLRQIASGETAQSEQPSDQPEEAAQIESEDLAAAPAVETEPAAAEVQAEAVEDEPSAAESEDTAEDSAEDDSEKAE